MQSSELVGSNSSESSESSGPKNKTRLGMTSEEENNLLAPFKIAMVNYMNNMNLDTSKIPVISDDIANNSDSSEKSLSNIPVISDDISDSSDKSPRSESSNSSESIISKHKENSDSSIISLNKIPVITDDDSSSIDNTQNKRFLEKIIKSNNRNKK